MLKFAIPAMVFGLPYLLNGYKGVFMCGIWQRANAAMAMAIFMLLGCHSAFAHTIPRKPFISAPKTPANGEATSSPADDETDEAQEKAALLKPSSYDHAKKDEEKAFASTPLPIPGDSFSRGAAEEPEPKVRQKGLLPNSWHDFVNQDGFFGDPWGARTWLSDHGITVGGRYFSDSAGNPFGGKSRAARYADEEALSIDFDLKKLAGLEFNAGVIHFLTLARQGAGLGNTLPVINSPMEIYGAGETMRLGRLSWEMHWNHYVQTEFGEINTENDFEQSSTYWGANLYCQFQNNGICGMPQSIAMNSGYGFYPTAHPGAWVKFFPAGNDHYLVQFGVYSVDPTISGVRNGWKMNLHGATGTFLPFQLGWHQGGEDDYSGPLQTNVKVGGYWDTSEVKNVYGQMGTYGIPPSAAEGAPISKVRGRFGGWFQFDRMLQRDEADPHRGTAFFGSFTWGDPRTAIAPYYMTAGITRKGTFASRPDDTISLGMKSLWANPKVTHWIQHLQRSGRGAGLYAPHSEEAIELNYGYRPARWLLLRPGLQYLWNPGAIKRYKDAMLIDLETAIAF